VVVGMRALVPGAIPLAGSVFELVTKVAVGGWLYWSPVAFPPLLILLTSVSRWQPQLGSVIK
jgi:hypothetical protein